MTRGARGIALAVLIAVASSLTAFAQADSTGQFLVPRAALKLIIEHPALEPYLQQEIAARAPIVVSDHLLEPGLTPSRFGQRLAILGDRDIGAQRHLRFRSVTADGVRATVVIECEAERMEASFTLEKSASGWWTVVNAKASRR